LDLYDKAAEILAGTRKAAAFTGAGTSAESGIPTFRDPGGLWDRFDPEEFGTIQGILNVINRQPETIRGFLLDTIEIFEKAKPNPGHYALAELEEMGILHTVITQNIDNLHTEAGNTDVLEVHGNLFRARCISCGRRYPLKKEDFLKNARRLVSEQQGFGLDKILSIMPKCECGGITRPDVVMFGEPVQVLNQSFQAASSCEVMLVLGTSGVVYPAAALPHQAKEAGAKLIEINPTGNYYRGVTEVFIQEASGEGMPKVMERVRKLIAS